MVTAARFTESHIITNEAFVDFLFAESTRKEESERAVLRRSVEENASVCEV